MSKSKQLTDDLFEKSSMSFGEHLEELRKSFAKAFIWLGLGTIIGLVFAEKIVLFIESPLKLAIRDFHIAQAKVQFLRANEVEPSEELADWLALEGMMPERVFIDPEMLAQSSQSGKPQVDPESPDSAPDSAPFEPTPFEPTPVEPVPVEPVPVDEQAKSLVGADLKEPLANPWKDMNIEKLTNLKPVLLWRPIASKLVSLTPVEGFMVWMKAGLVAGVVIASPGIFWHIWQFLAAGLYPHERRYVFWYLPLSLFLFLGGVSLAFFVIFRLVLGFLMTYTTGLDVDFTPRLNDYMSFALFLPLGFGIAFQLPILMLGLHRFGVVNVTTFISQWRIAVLVIAFLSMILTPADVYSMIGLFIPLVCLYFFGIVLCKYMPRGPGIGSAALDPKF